MANKLPRLVSSAALAIGVLWSGADIASAAEPEIKEISLGFGLDLPYLPHVVAIEKGWFEEAGFTDVETRTFTAGVLAGEALVAGQIHLWSPGNLPPVSMFHNGIPIVILGPNAIAWEATKLLVRADAGVDDPEDLYGIKIGLLQGSTAGADLNNLLEHYGLDPARVETVNLAPPEQLASLTQGDIQGMMVWEPWITRGLAELDSKVVHSGTKSFFESNHGEDVRISHTRTVFVASQDFVRDNPNTVDALIDVLVRAQQYVADPANRDEVVRLFSEFQDQDVAMNEALYPEFIFSNEIDQTFVEDMEAMGEFLLATGRIKENTDILEYTYTDPWQKAAPAMVKIEGRWQP